MKFLDLTFPTPAENLACDEALLDVCEEHGEETLRFWESPVPFVVVGYGNRIASEVNVEECQRRGIPVLRRCSGGGTVVQGPGCLNYNLTLRWDESGPLASVTGTNQFIMERNRAALAQLLGVEVSVQGHTDLAFRETQSSRWIKFSGNAQRRRRRALVFHGTILHGFDLLLIEASLNFPSAQPDYRASRRHTEFVRNIPSTPGQIRAALTAAWNASDSSTAIPHERKMFPLVRAGSETGAPSWPERPVDIWRVADTTARLMSAETTNSIAPGQRVTVRIHDVAFGGDGVGKHGELVVFVPFTMVGEEVEVEITEAKKNFARGKIARVITPSPERVTPECAVFGFCGGCQYQHLNYPTQLALKHKQVADLFERIGKFPREVVRPVVGCPQPYGYRNRIMIRSQWNKPEQRLNIGYLRWDCGLVVDVKTCPIAEPALNAEVTRVWENPPPKGGIKVALRIPPEDWDVPNDSFFQNNFFLLPKLVEAARNALVAGGAKYLVDVYCGVGFFGISLGDAVEKFVGVEIDKPAIKAAKNNLMRHQRTNGEFVLGDAQELLPGLLQKFPAGETSIILDPPRAGVPKSAIEQLREVRPRQIIYVSCHPATLARDLNLLCADGVFELVSVTPLDMFPQTQHVECVADVRLRAADAAPLD